MRARIANWAADVVLAAAVGSTIITVGLLVGALIDRWTS